MLKNVCEKLIGKKIENCSDFYSCSEYCCNTDRIVLDKVFTFFDTLKITA